MPKVQHDEQRGSLSWLDKYKVSANQRRAHLESQRFTGKTTPVVNEELVLVMRYLYWRKGWSQKRVAQFFELPPTTISSIMRNRSWKHVYLPEDWEPSKQ